MLSGEYFISIESYVVHCCIKGSGEPILCLHGLNQDHTIFQTLKVKEILQNKMVITVDLPGYGKSDLIPAFDFDRMEQIVQGVAEFVGIRKFEICGYCMGGIFALDYSIRQPESIKKLYLVETMIYLPWWMNVCLVPYFHRMYESVTSMRKLIEKVNLPSLKQLAKNEEQWKKAKKWNHEVNRYYILLMKKYGKIDHLYRSRQVTCETHIITAQQTFKSIKQTSYDLEKTIRNTKIVQLKEKGHFVY